MCPLGSRGERDRNPHCTARKAFGACLQHRYRTCPCCHWQKWYYDHFIVAVQNCDHSSLGAKPRLVAPFHVHVLPSTTSMQNYEKELGNTCRQLVETQDAAIPEHTCAYVSSALPYLHGHGKTTTATCLAAGRGP